MDKNFIARLCHEVNRAYCAGTGDNSQPAWDDAPEWQKTSAVNGVEAHLKTDLTPAQSHESWLAEKAAAGWRYGITKDPVEKTHPCFCAYEYLPTEQKVKDYLFKAVVDAFKAGAAATPQRSYSQHAGAFAREVENFGGQAS